MHTRIPSVLALLGTAVTLSGTNKQAAPSIPFTFVENRGQTAAAVRYIGTGAAFQAWFETRAVLLKQQHNVTSMSFVTKALDSILLTAENPIGAEANYLRGSDPAKWQTNLPLFSSIRYTGIWPGVELLYRAENGGLKAEYLVRPGAHPEDIRLHFSGSVQIQSDGDLRITGLSGILTEERPLIYQMVGGERQRVEGGFQILPGREVGFRVATYDRSRPLVIDPSILLSGYFGGSGNDNITAIQLDSLNNIVVAGFTSSPNLPSSGGARPNYRGSVDAFVASFQPNGGALNYCTYLGGSGADEATGIAIDRASNVYITGWTSSPNFPVVNGFQTHLGGTRDAFVTKLNATGNTLVYSSYLGGSGVDSGNAIGLNQTGAVAAAIVVGDTTSANLPVIGAFQPRFGGAQDAFVAMVSPAGNSLVFLSYLGGSGVEHASSVVVAPKGGIFVGGYTSSINFPTVLPTQPKSGGGQDGFLTKVGNDGAALFFSTYLGGAGADAVNGVALDSQNDIVVAGTTSSGNFTVTPGVWQNTPGGQSDGFVTRFSSAWRLLQSTYLGGYLADSITGVAVDFGGAVYVTGSTDSPDFPVQWPVQAANAGLLDAFVLKMNSTLSSVVFGTYLGGTGSDQANAIAVDSETSILVAGQTASGNFPITGNLQNYLPAAMTSFITKIRPNFTLGVAYPNAGQMEFTADPWHVMTDTASTLYGLATDIPLAGDWTGTGVKRIGIFRNGTWILDTNGNGIIDAADKTVVFGQAGDIPVVGDWRGTGQIALGLYRRGTFILDLSGHLSGVPTGLSDVTYSNFGLATDIPVAADWSGSGTAKVGVFRNGTWLVDYNGTGVSTQTWTYGQAGDLPVIGDWDSSGNPPKIGVYRSGLWILDYDGDHVLTTPGLNEMSLGFGFGGYTPLVF